MPWPPIRELSQSRFVNTTDWTAVAACATAAMAIATFVLALKTKSMAEGTKAVGKATLQEAQAVEKQVEQVERQVAISAAALRVSAQPWLAWEPSFEVDQGDGGPFDFRHGSIYSPGWHTGLSVSERDDSVIGWFTVRNVGNGIALLDMSSSCIYPKNGTVAYEDIHPSVETPVVPRGGTVDVEFKIPATHSADQQKMTLLQLTGSGGHQLFTIEVAYGDSLGNAGTSAKFRAHRPDENSEWSIFEVEYKLDDGKVITTRRFG
jgi:hypothetical protein